MDFHQMQAHETLEHCENVLESSHTWNLENFKTLINNEQKTKEISIPGIPFKWQLGIKMKEWSNCNPGDSYVPEVIFKLVFSDDDDDDDDELAPTKYERIECEFEIGAFWQGSATLFPKDDSLPKDLTHYIKSEDLETTEEGALEIECQMKVTGFYLKREIFTNFRNSDKKLMRNFGAILLSEEFADLTLVVKDQELKVHKFILAARSPVFKLMLATEMKEKVESRITIPDVSVEAVRVFVTFLYTATVTVTTTEHSKDLLYLAALHQIDDLKLACERMLITQLKKENALENLYVANLHNFLELKMKSFQMITQSLRTIPEYLMNQPKTVEEMMTAMKKWYDPPQNALPDLIFFLSSFIRSSNLNHNF